ncbi:MAG: UDP-N-acetylmuramoylalanyl-D-glutamyl-2, 6-diaminopimelate--D-alanyl-D-alanine ligase, partial [Leptospiraceae bacterium]|nr:UDP-N-acetylmuramoylalanyl-D-glutamyl-2, 6-diaminopimelate--D-alanyl-D-alanine ligase [Leptospiraceae bacterium]
KFSISKLREGILNFTFKDKRNVIFRGKYNIYDDSYNANPDSMKSSLETLFKLSGPSNSVAILGDMKELGKFSKKYHKELGEFAANLKLKYLITFGKESEEISKSFREKMGSNNSIHFLNDKKGKIELIQFIERTFNQNDFIRVKGSRSMKMEEIVEELKKNE